MRHLLAAAALAAAATAADAQAPRRAKARPASDAGVARMEIQNGPNTTVRYFADGASPGEAGTLRELERVENEASYARDLQGLKREYVLSERLLEPVRRGVQQQQYGLETSSTSYGGLGGFGGGYGFAGGYGAGLPVAGYGFAGGYNYGGFTPGFSGGFAGVSTATRSLANGVGPEGRVKEAMAQVLAKQSDPEYAASLDRAADRVALRASASPTLRAALRLPAHDAMRRESDGIRAVSDEMTPAGAVTLTLKGGGTLRGTNMKEAGDWLTLDLPGGGKSRVRLAEVTRIDQGPARGVVPAVED